MALTTHIKTTSTNVTTGYTAYTYFTEEEWQGVLDQNAIKVVTIARDAKKAELNAEAQSSVDAIIAPYEILEAQMRALELLEAKLEGPLDTDDATELAVLKTKRANAKAVRVAQAAALQALAAATTVAEIESITL